MTSVIPAQPGHLDAHRRRDGARRLGLRAIEIKLKEGLGFEPTNFHFENLAISCTALCICLSEETLTTVDPFYLECMTTEGSGNFFSLTHKVNDLDL